ncbi:hypothetical protein C7H19_22395 [Aphanothece hegewaldii CCALA 016]|uniref:Serine protease n=1 Tax=Aphanothece hegewaldii CCALA 016 TaxID=2107694 RepID=A0A2T1LS15_9CHRO|nr:serine protease [Aphanothece hegewaldii]PSF31691.1 hypothetical protein C7H19_22395 [Aphanothece hegewaldii CCALA 016]
MKRLMKVISRMVFLLLLVWIPLSCQLPLSSSQKLEQLTKTITVRVFRADEANRLGGSGVLIDRSNNQYWVITNDHVVFDRKLSYKIQTFDGRTYPVQIVSPSPSPKENDLALLTFKTDTPSYSVLTLKASPKMLKEESVLAGGFPFFDDFHQAQDFHFTQGKLMMVLDEPFLGGYQIGYTNLLRNGMSGGPVVNQKGELLGINGMAQDPLLGNPYIFPDGKTVSEKAWQQVSQLSWAISVQTIRDFVQQHYLNPSL